jgi:hypothetical protein
MYLNKDTSKSTLQIWSELLMLLIATLLLLSLDGVLLWVVVNGIKSGEIDNFTKHGRGGTVLFNLVSQHDSPETFRLVVIKYCLVFLLIFGLAACFLRSIWKRIKNLMSNS